MVINTDKVNVMASRRIMINCGHGKSLDGSWDSGCVWGKYTEADLMLSITKAAVKYLRDTGMTVFSDSDTGNDKNMVACVDWANREKVELYISIHCDYSGAPIGVMPLYVSASGKKLGECLNKAITAGMDMASRGVQKRTDLYELNETEMPAVVLETGSIKLDLSFLKDFDKYGKCIAEGVCEYLGIREEPEPVATGEVRKYKCKQTAHVYKNHSIASGRTGKDTSVGEIYSATKWVNEWIYVPDLKGWVPTTGKGGVYLERLAKIRYVVTYAGGVNVYKDHSTKSMKLDNVIVGAFLTVTKWWNNWGYAPAVSGWVAMSCLTEESLGTRLFRDCVINGRKLADAGVKYDKDSPPTTLAGAIAAQETDCSHYMSFALQDEGILPKGQYIWLDKSIHGSGADDLLKSDKVKVIRNYGKTAKQARLPFGAIVGYGYRYKGKDGKMHDGRHMQMSAGYTSAGNPLWMSGGVSDVNGKNYGPKRKTTYENRIIDVLILPKD